MPLQPTTSPLSHVVIRFAGDSGDGMQLAGTEFTRAAALAGNDISTLPDYPAEIRAPAGTLAGVSGFQLHFSSVEIHTPGDAPDVLIAMNPAALKANIKDVKKGGTVVVDQGQFTQINLTKAGYIANPLEDGSLSNYRLIPVDMSNLVTRALEGTGLSVREMARSKNFWALGLVHWMYHKPLEPEVQWVERKFAKKPQFATANIAALKAGYHYGETAEVFQETVSVEKAPLPKGRYRSVTGNSALAIGLVVAAAQQGQKLFLGSYPITPASDILHELSKYKNCNVTTFQAEDEIAAAASAIGASYGGAIGVCTTSGPGFALKAEAIGLSVMLELPLVVIDVQRAGPSTGMPTKPEQADLLQAMYGRNGESPLPIIAPKSPADCYEAAIEAVRVATRYMCPVVLLSDAFVANSAEPWRLPDTFPQKNEHLTVFRTNPENYQVYARQEETLARDWVLPGTPKMEHRIGGLEKNALTGEISYDGHNHEKMVTLRAEKVKRVTQDMGPLDCYGPDTGDVLIVGWGGTYGALHQAAMQLRGQGAKVSHLHLRWLNPLSDELEKILRRFKHVLVCELNTGQLCRLIRAEYLIPAVSHHKLHGKPFSIGEIVEAVMPLLGSTTLLPPASTVSSNSLGTP